MKYVLLISFLVISGCGKTNSVVGSQGAAGSIGPAGPSGTSCTVATLTVGSPGAPNGGSLVTCPDGTASVVLNGTPGSNGTNGTDGTNGTAGTVVTPMQFCSGFTQSYPNTFAESGLCINNELYGVYSANSGFLALLPPGTYSSDGINSSCTFTIGNNCSVN